MKKAFLALSLLVAFALTGCSAGPDTEKVSGCDAGLDQVVCDKTVSYKGHSIDCIAWNGSHGEVGLTCDFVKYHNENG